MIRHVMQAVTRLHAAVIVGLVTSMAGGVILIWIFGTEGEPISPLSEEAQAALGHYPATCGPFAADANDLTSISRPHGHVLLDLALAGRRIPQGGMEDSDLSFKDPVRVGPREVLQVSTIVQNASSLRYGDVANAFRLKISIPQRTAPLLSILATAESDNARRVEPYKLTDTLVIRGRNGTPIRFGNARNPQVQRNERHRSLRWAKLQDIPICAVAATTTDEFYDLTIPSPEPAGGLSPSLLNSFRVSFLLDVHEGV